MIELGNMGGKQAEKQHCKLEHVVEREREREECKRAAVERKHELLRRCSYRWVESVSVSDDRAPPFAFFFPLSWSTKLLHHWPSQNLLSFFLPPTHTTKFLVKIPSTESTCSTLIFSFQRRYPVAFDRVHGSLAG